MCRWRTKIAAVVLAASTTVVHAGVPEPDYVLFGSLALDDTLVKAGRNVAVIARVGGPAGRVVGRFLYGTINLEDCNNNAIPDGCEINCGEGACQDWPTCGTAADADDDGIIDTCNRYVLRIRMETAASGEPLGSDAAQAGDSISLFVADGDGALACSNDGNPCTSGEDCLPGGECLAPEVLLPTPALIGEPGKVQALSIGVLTLVASSPPSGAIDARQTSDPDGSDPAGWDTVDMTFDGAATAVTPSDFTVTSTSGAAPTVTGVTPNGNVATVQLSTFIPAGAWTTITHTPSNTSTRLGYLPGDVTADRTSSPLDILALIDFLNGIGIARPEWSTDLDRSAQTNPADILRLIDLLNGAGALEPWNGATLPP